MNSTTAIQVAELLGKTAHTREAANQLLSRVAADPCPKIELDFSAVDYISRSFADQFHAGQMQLMTEQQKEITVTNANEEVVSMLHAVAKTQNKTYWSSDNIPVYKYSSWEQLEDFLLSV